MSTVTTTIQIQLNGDVLTIPKIGQSQNGRTQLVEGGGNPGVIDLTTSEVDISFGALDAPHEIYIFNMDDTEVVSYGPKNGSNVIQLLAEIDPLRENIISLARTGPPILRMKSSGNSRVFIAAFED